MKDVKIISAGRILENSRTLGECRSPLCDVPGGVTTMHVLVQAPPLDKGILFSEIVENHFSRFPVENPWEGQLLNH